MPTVADRFSPGPEGTAQSFAVMQAQALLAALDAGDGDGDPRDLPFEQVAGALMQHEQRWWQALAAPWDWGSGGPPALAVQERSITALALLGGDSPAKAWQVLRRVPELGDAPAERLSAIGSWVLALYPPGADLPPRIRPDLIGDWFVVTQLAADPGLARSLRTGLTDDQAARALALLARAADSIAAAAPLFSEFAAGGIRRIILAAAQAARTGRVGRHLLDAIIAGQLPSTSEWTLDRLDEIGRLIPEHMLLLTRVTIASLIVNAYRALAAGSPAAHQARLADALSNLGTHLDQAGSYQEMLATRTEAVAIFRELASADPELYQAEYQRLLGALRREYDQRGMSQEALTHDLPPRHGQLPGGAA